MFKRLFSGRKDADKASVPPHLSFDEFLRTPPGELLLDWESKAYADLTLEAFGSAALQIGMPELDTLQENRIQSQWYIERPNTQLALGRALPADANRIVADPAVLPIADESIDLITLPHVLDLDPTPQRALSEAVRVLEPEGRLILTAFNPLGTWWLRQQTVRLGAKPYLPTNLSPIPLYRIKDWFALLGLEIDRGSFGIYRPGWRSSRRLAAWQWLDKAGDRWLPHCSNIILLSAVKHIQSPRIVSCSELSPLSAKVAASGVPAASSATPSLSENISQYSK